MRLDQLLKFLKRLLERPAARFGMICISIFTLIAIFAPFLAPHDPIEINLANVRAPPSWEYPLGTDENGRDILSRIIWGSRLTFMVGLLAVALGTGVGIPLGTISGYFRRIDFFIMSETDLMLSFPAFLLAIAVVTVMGPSLENAMISVGVSMIPRYIRFTRGLVLSVREENYIEAARMDGENDGNIIARYIIPNCISSILILATLDLPQAIIYASALSFLGLGAQPPTPEWGMMISTGRTWILTSPHLTTYPGLALLAFVLGFNLLGDALRDALDPRLRYR